HVRELETLFLTMFAAVPLYFTHAIGKAPVALFHLAMLVLAARVTLGRTPELIPASWMRWLAVAYVPFYFVDWRLLAGSAIAASTHLVLFIAVYQPAESLQRNNHAQRMLTTSLIFVASLATSTHITIMPFVVLFAFLMLRQLMHVSHIETVRSIGKEYGEPPSAKAAGFYLAGAVAIGAALFPLLPRVRNPLVHGILGSLQGSATTLTDTINFNEPRISSNDATVVARVWMDQEARAFFAPIRLRGMIYDRYGNGQWQQTLRGLREVPTRDGVAQVGRARGAEREAIVQMRPQRGKLFLPSNTVLISGLPSRLYEGPGRETYYTYHDGVVNLTVRMAFQSEPLRLQRMPRVEYPISPEIAGMARAIVGNETDPTQQAARIERYLLTNYRYVPNPADLGKIMSVDDFLLRERAGHCEYFAAGMAVLLTAVDVPARIVGGFYGGRLNPLTGYYSIRREDAHAWTEVWDGRRWVTFDATPPSLRPGSGRVNVFRDYLSAIGDSATFVWDRYVLTFGLGDQVTLAQDLIDWGRAKVAEWRERLASDARGILAPQFLGLLSFVLIAGALAVFTMRRHRPLFDVLARHLAAHGILVGPSMTME
ncbi:MAG: transglutaminaseTgpA domain-containing protein, partial [Thermoanaerobaculia bacterium]